MVSQALASLDRRVHRDEIDAFDATYETDTCGTIQPWNLDIPDDFLSHAVQYGSAGVMVFRDLLKTLPICHREYTFVDLGSGKGRALLLASYFPYRKIIGVELSQILHAIACRNIQIFRAEWQKCSDISSICENAVAFNRPADNVVLYLFNPFDEHVLQKVILKWEESLQRTPRRMYIVYVKPVYRRILDSSRHFTLLKMMGNNAIYQTVSELPA